MAVLVMALVTVVACGKPPQEDIDAAKAALDAAKTAQADKWAGTDYQTAESSLSAAQAEVDAQAQKWFKNYDKAKELMMTAKADAEKAAGRRGRQQGDREERSHHGHRRRHHRPRGGQDGPGGRPEGEGHQGRPGALQAGPGGPRGHPDRGPDGHGERGLHRREGQGQFRQREGHEHQ